MGTGCPTLRASPSSYPPFFSRLSLSLSPGDSSRTCLTMRWTRSPTLNSWSKFHVGHGLPHPSPSFLLSCPPVHLPSPGPWGSLPWTPKPAYLLLVGQKSSVSVKRSFCFSFFQKRSGFGPVFPEADAGKLKGEGSSGQGAR